MTDLTDYPPVEHLGRDLHIAYSLPERGRIALTIPVVPHILRTDGTVQTEALATVIDEATGFVSVFTCLPDWASTAALSIGITGAVVEPEGVLAVDSTVVKAGKRLVFVEATVRWGSVLVAHAQGEFARVPRADQNLEMDGLEPDPGQVFALGLPDSGLDKPYPERLGLATLDASGGVLDLPFEDYTRNSAGILHGGVVGALALTAAEAASGGRVIAAHVQYLSAGRVGPFRTTAERWYGQGDGVVWRTETRDQGHGQGQGDGQADGEGDDKGEDSDGSGRLMTRATVTTSGGVR
jgi:acyl-coenzyme A thioesterase PaaI-like protein